MKEIATQENKFKIKFRGTRGSYPVAKANFLNYGGNTACVELKCANQTIILDAGTGIIDIGQDEKLQSEQNNQVTILISHLHQDHIQGLPFYKPLYNSSNTINLFGLKPNNENLKEALKAVLFDKVFPLGIDEIKSNFNIQNLSPKNLIVISQDEKIKLYNQNDDIKTNEDDIIISIYKTPMHPKNGCLCFKIKYRKKTLVYATDKESQNANDKDFIEFARNCDCLIHDAQYTNDDYLNPKNPKQGFGHSTFEMAIDIAHLTKAKKLFFFHYDPEYDDNKLSQIEKELTEKFNCVFFAKENYEFEI